MGWTLVSRAAFVLAVVLTPLHSVRHVDAAESDGNQQTASYYARTVSDTSPTTSTPKLKLVKLSSDTWHSGDYFFAKAHFDGPWPAKQRPKRLMVQVRDQGRWTSLAQERVGGRSPKVWARLPLVTGKLWFRLAAKIPKKSGTKTARIFSKSKRVRISTNPFPAEVVGAFRDHEAITDLTVDSAGTVYVAGDFPIYKNPKNVTLGVRTYQPRIMRQNPDMTWTVMAGSGELGDPVAGPAASSPMGNISSIAVDSHGTIYANSGCNVNAIIECGSHVVRISHEGTLSITGGGGSDALAVTPQDDVLIRKGYHGDIARLTNDGQDFAWLKQFPECAESEHQGFGDSLAVTPVGRVFEGGRCGSPITTEVTDGGLMPVAGNGSESQDFVAGPALSTPIPNYRGFGADARGNIYLSIADGLVWVTAGGQASLHPVIENKVTNSGYPEITSLTIGADDELYALAEVSDPKSDAACGASAPAFYGNDCTLVLRLGRP